MKFNIILIIKVVFSISIINVFSSSNLLFLLFSLINSFWFLIKFICSSFSISRFAIFFSFKFIIFFKRLISSFKLFNWIWILESLIFNSLFNSLFLLDKIWLFLIYSFSLSFSKLRFLLNSFSNSSFISIYFTFHFIHFSYKHF